MKTIKTNGIAYIELLAENSDWYCGTDYACGDLYEAAEAYKTNRTIRPNRLIFIHHPDGELIEPVKLSGNRYFGRPAQIDGNISIPVADFDRQVIQVLGCGTGFRSVSVLAELPLCGEDDCINLLLKGRPLMLTRQAENRFEVIWPEKVSFEVGGTESFVFRDGNEWVFSKYTEDPDYKEEVIVRNGNGEIVKTIRGSIFVSPAGETWILD